MSERRYSFQPLERRGLLLGLDAPQIATILGSALLAMVLVASISGAAGGVAAVSVLATGSACALCPVQGRPMGNWVPVAASWAARRGRGPSLSREPFAGNVAPFTAGAEARRCSGGTDPGETERGDRVPSRRAARALGLGQGIPADTGVQVIEVAGTPGREPVGVAHDRRHRLWVAVMPVQGRSFSLLDKGDQVQRLDAWRAVLATLGRSGTPLQRVQWVERSGPASGSATPTRWLAGGPHAAAPTGGRLADDPGRHPTPAGAPARTSYEDLVAGAFPAVQAHQAWLALAVSGSYRARSPGSRAVDVLLREVRLLEGQLRNADLRAGEPLGRDGLTDLLAPWRGLQASETADPAGRSRRGPILPMASDEAWSAYRIDGTWHATYWVAEWPRVDVPPDFLAPLLICAGQRAVSVVMAPVDPRRALREVRSARTADVADEQLRSSAGFLPSARRGK
ncbi:MAG: SCO6880 family protein, partial [Acidimicrobiales bacterium]